MDPALQGRVYATKQAVGQSLMLVGYLLRGVMADRWLEPMVQPDGAWAPLFGSIVGTGPGAGIGLMFLVVSLLGGAISLGGYLLPGPAQGGGRSAGL